MGKQHAFISRYINTTLLRVNRLNTGYTKLETVRLRFNSRRRLSGPESTDHVDAYTVKPHLVAPAQNIGSDGAFLQPGRVWMNSQL